MVCPRAYSLLRRDIDAKSWRFGVIFETLSWKQINNDLLYMLIIVIEVMWRLVKAVRL